MLEQTEAGAGNILSLSNLPVFEIRQCSPNRLLVLNLPFKDLSMVKPSFKSVPLQFHFEIAELAIAKMWQEIQNVDGEERF